MCDEGQKQEYMQLHEDVKIRNQQLKQHMVTSDFKARFPMSL